MPKVVAIGGEGIGPEVIQPTLQALEQLGVPGLEIIQAEIGDAALKKYGSPFPSQLRQMMDEADAILFGAVERTIIVLGYLRWGLGNYANIRPIKYYPGAPSPIRDPQGIDFVIVRENLEGMYAAAGREISLRRLVSAGIFSQQDLESYGEKALCAPKIISERGSERIARFAFQIARNRKLKGKPGKLSIIHKDNVLRMVDGLFKRTAYHVSRDYPEIQVEDFYVDDAARRFLRYPKDFDVVLCVNEYGDILSDLGAELVGGLGLAPSGVMGGRVPYFEPVHGSAPKYAGLGIANPMAAMLSAALMLDYLGFPHHASRLENAVAQLIKLAEDPESNWRKLPRDLVPPKYRDKNMYASTNQVAQEIISRL